MNKILDGKKLSNLILSEIYKEIKIRKKSSKKLPHLGIILLGNNPFSLIYVNKKINDCQKLGIKYSLFHLSIKTSQKELILLINKLNINDNIDGFIIQLPLPKNINKEEVILSINPSKDIDGLHPFNIGSLCLETPTFIPATTFGIFKLLQYYKINTIGKNVIIIGRSNIVGKPMSILMSLKNWGNSTVTLLHSYSKNIIQYSINADIIITALGVPKFLQSNMIKKGSILIDVGINRIKTHNGYRIIGDIDFENVYNKVLYITPVPGGVGPMTRAMLLQNLMIAVHKKS